jgi:hypothetical protein
MLVIIILSLFFLYLLMFSGGIGTVLPCNVQYFLKNNIFFKHIMIFSTIFFFTYILNWYTPHSVFEYNYDEHDKNIWLFYKESIIIYIIFLVSSCLNITFLILSFIVMFIFINISTYRNYKYKNDNNKLYSIIDYPKRTYILNTLKDLFNYNKIINNLNILNKKENKKYKNLYISILLENILKIIYIIILIIGFFYNLIKTKKHEKNKFKLNEFIFSIRKCTII